MTPDEEAMERLARDLAGLNRRDSAMPVQPDGDEEGEK